MIALAQTRDAALVNSFINDPAVFPHCGFPAGIAWADCSSRIGDDDLVFVTDGGAAMMCFQRRRDGWEKHNLFRAGCRGRAAINVGTVMLDWASEALPTSFVLANTPITNRAARWFNRQIGMMSLGCGVCPLTGPVERFKKDMTCQ